jgi:hypothetical protein
MCEKCNKLEKKIEHYRMIVDRVLDSQLAEGVTKLIEEAETPTAKLHEQSHFDVERRAARELTIYLTAE